MNQHIQKLQQEIEPLRNEIINHKVYSFINTIDDLKIFMQHHVYAVWDFMSLLKSLQNNLTCTSIPWFPKGSADTRFLINEIVVGEESDVDLYGVRKSHFELYLEAMQQIGADTQEILRFTQALQNGSSLQEAFTIAQTPKAAKAFVEFTFSVIESQKDYLQSAIFTFGREDLIPGMFMSLVNDIYKSFPDNVATFKYYLERHIEVDGDHHSHLALQMTDNLCNKHKEYWEEATSATLISLQHRKELWDSVYDVLSSRN